VVSAVRFLGTAIAAAILPWRKKALYENSPIARYKVAGIPLITLTGTATALFLGWNLYTWLWPPFNSSSGNLYAINVPSSLWFMGSMYGLALVVYLIAKFYRKSQGIDLKSIYQEIPVE
jgi:APA family basic amino acid/polyamine antiporter